MIGRIKRESKTCPNCGRKAYIRKDGSTGCQACGYGIEPRKNHEKTLRCPFCERVIAYVCQNGSGRCSKCGYVSNEEMSEQKKKWKMPTEPKHEEDYQPTNKEIYYKEPPL